MNCLNQERVKQDILHLVVFQGKNGHYYYRFGKVKREFFVHVWMESASKRIDIYFDTTSSIEDSIRILSYFGIEKGRSIIIRRSVFSGK